MSKPFWERGYRCHGYWLGERRVGRVSIGPKSFHKPGDGYMCEFVEPSGKEHSFKRATLSVAKRAVELGYMKFYPPPTDEKCDLCKKPAHEIETVYERIRWGAAVRHGSGTGFAYRSNRWCYDCRVQNQGAYSKSPGGR